MSPEDGGARTIGGERSYRLLRELGRGGMGVVWLAERADGEFRQQVAVKLLSGDRERGEQIVRRFRTERQILASLDHPGIAKLLDGGSLEDGAPYFVLEYVEGAPIDRFCREAALPVRDRVELFLRVCEAVESAHQRLIVHRDLKPGNILVTPDGEPKLLDFGIAKLLDPLAADWTLAETERGLAPLTLRYASPEQLRGEPIGTTSDVYSLGVVLFELLAGRSPYALGGRSIPELSRAICEEEPLAPSTAARLPEPDETVAGWGTTPEREPREPAVTGELSRDLDAIVLKALRKEAAERYPSVAALAEDLRRYLDGRPVEARRGSRLYTLGKFVRRHRWSVGAAAAFVLLLVGWALSLGRQLERTRLERDRAERVKELFVEAFSASDPMQQKGDAVTAREILERATPRLERELADQPAVLAPLLEASGRIYRSLDLLDQAEPLLERALDLARREPGPERRNLRSALSGLAELRLRQARSEEAIALLEEALEPGRGGSAPDAERARLLLALGLAFKDAERFDDSAEALAEAHRLTLASHPERDEEVAEVLEALGTLAWDRGELDDAGQRLGESFELLTAIDAPPARRAAAASDLAAVLNQRGEHLRAEKLLRDALELEKRAFGPDHPNLAVTYNNLAVNLYYQRSFSEASDLAAAALEITERALGPDHPDVAATRVNLGALLLAANRVPEAERQLERAAEVLERSAGAGAGRLAVTLRTLSMARYVRGDFESARQLLDRADAATGELPDDHPVRAGNAARRGILLHALGDLDGAERELRRAIAIQDRVLAESHPDRVAPLADLAALLTETGRPAEAEPLARRAVALAGEHLPPGSLEEAWSRAALGAALCRTGAGAEGRPLLVASRPDLEAWLGPGHPRVRFVRAELTAEGG